MRKIFLWGYWVKNFGDDLFLKVYLEQIKEFDIITYILTEKKYKSFYQKMGIRTICKDTFIYRLTYKLLISLGLPELFFLMISKKSLFVMLGGSLFAENKGIAVEKLQFKNLFYAVSKAKKSFVIGSNFGPYSNESYKNKYEMLFSKMEDVCFRDKKSYEMFSQSLKNVRYAPDIAFEGKWNKSNNQINKSIVISVINLENRTNLSKFKEKYEKVIAEICIEHIKKGNKVYLISLCEKEGDILSCSRIQNMVKKNTNYYPEIKEYTSIDKTIKLFSSAKKIYATRFHALMVGLYFNKNIVPIIYNEKGINAIQTYCESLSYFLIEDFNDLTSHKMIETNQIAKLKLTNSKQFQELINYCKTSMR